MHVLFNIEIETWKAIAGFNGRYEVSNMGRVRGMCPYRQWKAGRIRKLQTDKRGYRVVGLNTAERKMVVKKVHRLVMEGFIGPDERTVNHKDGNKANNCLENLEYMSIGDNIRHAHKSGFCSKTFGEKHWRAKLSDVQVEEMAQMERDDIRHKIIAKRFGIRRETVSSILRKRYAHLQASI